MDPNQNRKFNTLHRNKACLSCRARKTKCDAVKPVCSSCKRLGQSQPIECKYDQPPKWLSDVVSSSQSKEKKKLAELKSKLESLQSKFRQLKLDRSVQEHNYRQLKSFNHLIATNENQSDGLNLSNTKSSNTSHIMHSPESDLTNPSLNETSCSIENSRNPFYQNPDYLSSGPSCSKPIEPQPLSLKQDIQVFQGSLTSPVFAPSTTQTFDPQMAKNELSPLSSNNSLHSSLTLSNEISMASTVVKNRAPGTVTQHHLPSIAICQVLIRAYINKPLCPFNLIEPVEIFRRVESGYFHPSFPAFGLIHSLCAVGAQYVSQAELQQHYHQITEPIEQYHVRWAEFFLEKEMREYNFCNPKDGNRLIEIGQGFIVCSQHYSIKGLPLMMWKNLGCGIKICTALGLDREDQVEDAIPVDENMMIMWPDGVCNFGCSRTQEEYHYRTLLWWYTYCCERMCSSVSGFGVTVSESDASDKWICCSSQGRPDRFKHDLKSEEFFVNHDKPESEFDDEGDGNEGSRGALQLLIKAAILLGRVCSTVYRRSNISKPIKESEQEKEALSNLLMKFYHSFPGVYKKAFKFKFRGGLNSCLLSAHALVHSCLIALHEDEVRTIDLEDRDMKICTDSTRVILNWFQAVTHQNIDIGDLLCSNPTLGHALGVALRTHCKLIAFNETLGNYKAGESLRLELDGMLDTLKACRKLPMGG
ncbi:hypothetical protein BY996DRAFT_4579973 [Phakopsora pachyrhizi]|uniref:Expressed protein n=1 Tax=Phakopsora pachyrhizi TaxID=170000 RepID=A0AAV0AUT1_PHAPC|nr:hypothetical protein BY996DRAFT_4579973 [Phakopsora pachyrhizi]CAH7671847.1 expressed protein [Phakopsora pachyrhizi]CAH7686708.1 expressed protein [Phakopsora pachyrhizi]